MHTNRGISSRCLTEQELRAVADKTATFELFERAISHYPGCLRCEPLMLRLFEIQRAPQRVVDKLLKRMTIPVDNIFRKPNRFWHYRVRY